LMQDVIYNQNFMFGSTLTAYASRPHLGFLGGTTDKGYYYVVLAVVAVTLAILLIVIHSRLGKLLRALSESPTMLATHGLTVTVTRVTVFIISAFFAGVAGALMISQTYAVGAQSFPATTSLLLLAVLGICGTRLVSSSFLAAGLIALVPGYLTGFGADQQELAFGLAAIGGVILYAYRPRFREMVASLAAKSESRRHHSPVVARPMASLLNGAAIAAPVGSNGSGHFNGSLERVRP
jgi:ABC-type branched-subunit amino acid transport system permease subunit